MGGTRRIPDRDWSGAVRDRNVPQAGPADRARLSEGRTGLADGRLQRGHADQEWSASERGPAVCQLVRQQGSADHLRSPDDGDVAAHGPVRHQSAGLCAASAARRLSGRRLRLRALFQNPGAGRRDAAERAPTLRRGIVGPMAALTDKASARPSETPVLRVRGLTKSYGAARVVDNVSFDLDAGEGLT